MEAPFALKTALRYALPVLALSSVAGAFFLMPRPRPLGPRLQYGLGTLAALPLVTSGMLHLLQPQIMLPLLPAWLPERALLVQATGVPELAGALGLFLPRFRRPAAAWLALFMIAVFPANVYVAGERVQGIAMPGVPARTAMQAAYILLLLIVGYGWPRRAQHARLPAC